MDKRDEQETIPDKEKTPQTQNGETPEIPMAEEEMPDAETRQQLAAELDKVIERLQEMRPDYTPPPFSPQRLIELIEQNLRHVSPRVRLDLLQQLRAGVSEDLFDVEMWKGTWYLINYSLKYQLDIFRRRFTGEYETDEWGLDWEFVETIRPLFDFMYKYYWRVETTGMAHIPDYGRALIVANHSGQLPFDGAMIGTAVMNEHPAQRLVRNLYAAWFPTLPFFSALFEKMGQALATEENGIRLLEQEELVGVYPEGYKGVSKLFKDRYKLARFGRGGFVRMALATGAPMIPTAVVGAEEIYISLKKSETIAKLIRWPYFPISPRFPWLGLLGTIPYPTKWFIDFGEPIPTDAYPPDAAENMMLISQLTDQVRNIIQEMLNQRLAQRSSVFLG